MVDYCRILQQKWLFWQREILCKHDRQEIVYTLKTSIVLNIVQVAILYNKIIIIITIIITTTIIIIIIIIIIIMIIIIII